MHSTHFIYGYMASDRITHTMAFVTPVIEAQEIAQWVHHEGLIRWPIAPRANALPLSYVLLFPILEIQMEIVF